MLPILDPTRPDQPFPAVETALDDPDGLLAVGGCLSAQRLENAYRQGVFPWFNEGEPILWWSPDPRWVLSPDGVKVSRSLGKRLRREEFGFTFDRVFDQVVAACGAPRAGADGTWISPEIRAAYLRLHQQGLAHSFETWQDNVLVGGLYGVAIGQVFFGESMFHNVTDASKAAFVMACRKLHQWGYRLVDCQLHTAHLESMGAVEMPRSRFTQALQKLCRQPVNKLAWKTGTLKMP